MAQVDYTATLRALEAQQAQHPLSILTLAEPIIESTNKSQSQSQNQDNSRIRASDVSSEPSDAAILLTPSSLSADLTHYRELFSKLRFSYLEQVTKEKYLRAIVGDPPILVSHSDNVALEEELAAAKTELKARKESVDALVAEMEGAARALAVRWEGVQSLKSELERLGPEVKELRKQKEELEELIAEKRAERSGDAAQGGIDVQDPRMNMSLAQTEGILATRRAENAELDHQIAALQRALPGKMRECEGVERDLEGLERRREESSRQARDARRMREEGGRDRVEEMGRWYRSAEVVLGGLVGR